MMTNLFSVFDPTTSMNLSMNWISMIILLTIIPMKMWIIPNNMNFMMIKLIYNLYKEYKIIIYNKTNNHIILMFISIFIFIMINNFMSLFPYIFNNTAHISINLTLSLPIWMMMMMFGWLMKTNHMFTHLVPQGTPNLLIPFMVFIESISNMIRPITLMIRLTANMIAGHLLLTLLGNMGPKLNFLFLPMLIFTRTILLMLESAVSMIQAYVFAILITLYFSEI
uniref:ATP synthase subunit a n=1 Tax=Rhopalomyia pomum TaxID=608481 RepID=C7FIK8_RHOPM|nr:ATP synthase F0 subunit 6 [Rhopalomyia pomum]